jgi:hypothetical protein
LLYRIDFIEEVLVEFSNPLVFVRNVKAPEVVETYRMASWDKKSDHSGEMSKINECK